MAQLRKCSERVRAAKQYWLQKKYADKQYQLPARHRINRYNRRNQLDQLGDKQKKYGRNKRHAGKEHPQSVAQKCDKVARIFLLEAREHRQQRIQRKERCNGCKQKIRYAKRRVVQVENMSRAKLRRQNAVTQKGENLREKREACQ